MNLTFDYFLSISHCAKRYPNKRYPNKRYPNKRCPNKKCPNSRFTRRGLIQNTPLLGIVVNNFLVLGIEEHDLTRMPIMPFLRSQRTNEGYSMPSHGLSFSVYSFSHLHCVANVYAVWPVYTVKCLYSRGWEWETKGATPTSISIFDSFDLKSVNLQYNTLGRFDNGTNKLSTKRLMFQVFFFSWFLTKFFAKSFQFIFLFFFIKLQK